MQTDSAFEFQLSQIKTWAVFAHVTFQTFVDVTERPNVLRSVITAFCKAVKKQHCRLRYAIKREGDGVIQHVHFHVLIDGSSLRRWDRTALASEFGRCWQAVAGGRGNCVSEPYNSELATAEGVERGVAYFCKRQYRMNQSGLSVEIPYRIDLSDALKKHLERLNLKTAKRADRLARAARQRKSNREGLAWLQAALPSKSRGDGAAERV